LRGAPSELQRHDPEVRCLALLRGQLRRRASLQEQLVHALEPFPLRAGQLGVDQLVEARLAAHSSSPSSTDASFARPLRVRVFTVPSGRARNSATSLCDMPLQYASSITSRSRGWSSSRARCTRQETSDSSARWAGPGSADASSGSSESAAGPLRRSRSTIAFRATV